LGTRCETAGKYILPAFRSLVAKELVNSYHLTQVEAAKKLGTTQAAVSQYVSAKRAFSSLKQCRDVQPKIEVLASIAARHLAEGEASWSDVSLDFCRRCARCFVDEVDDQNADYVI
jgi:predicted transcriptional regulator